MVGDMRLTLPGSLLTIPGEEVTPCALQSTPPVISVLFRCMGLGNRVVWLVEESGQICDLAACADIPCLRPGVPEQQPCSMAEAALLLHAELNGPIVQVVHARRQDQGNLANPGPVLHQQPQHSYCVACCRAKLRAKANMWVDLRMPPRIGVSASQPIISRQLVSE